MKRKDKFEEHACEFKNEDDCEEDLEEEGLEKTDVEVDHFEEKEDISSGEEEPTGEECEVEDEKNKQKNKIQRNSRR